MSRKQFHSDDWHKIKQFSITHGYSPWKPDRSNSLPEGTLILVHHEATVSDSHPTLAIASEIKTILKSSSSAPPLCLVLDLTPLNVGKDLDVETSKLEFSKSGKKP